jgi:phospholipid/cholesterol/gamma-HCH transport system substrate-binding protein
MGRSSQDNIWSDFRVGIVAFVALALLILGIVFAGGDKGLLLQKKVYVKGLLTNVGGLKKGSSVTMGGMTIGKVTGIGFAGGSDSNQIEVVMQVRSDVRLKIKSDSVPSVRTQGMMGDRYVDISPGGPGAGPLGENEKMVGKPAAVFDETLEEALGVLRETEKLLLSINEKKGTVGQLFYDDQLYQNMVTMTDKMNELVQDFKKQPRKYIKFSVF